MKFIRIRNTRGMEHLINVAHVISFHDVGGGILRIFITPFDGNRVNYEDINSTIEEIYQSLNSLDEESVLYLR